jgi:metallo-beta-lactamase family protein
MVTGGRILHHLKVFAPNPRNTVIFTGYQSGGTRRSRMIAGEREIKIHGQMIPVRAQVKVLGNTSAHADLSEILLWLQQLKKPPKKIFITHGEVGASEFLKNELQKKFGWTASVPSYLSFEDLV